MIILSAEETFFPFSVVDLDGSAVTTLTVDDFTITLIRRAPTGLTFSAGTETVVIYNRSGGNYEAGLTPVDGSDGYIYFLTITEKIPFVTEPTLPSFGRAHEFWGVVGAAGTAIATDAFCSVEDVQRRVGRGAFSTTTVPTLSEALQEMTLFAARVQATLYFENVPYTVDSGSNPIPTTDVFGLTLRQLCRDANAFGAASTILKIFNVRTQIAEDDRVQMYFDHFKELLDKDLPRFLRGYRALSLGHSKSADMTDAPFTLDTRW